MTVPIRLSLKPRFTNNFKRGDYNSEPADDLRSYDDDFLPGTAWGERLKIKNESR